MSAMSSRCAAGPRSRALTVGNDRHVPNVLRIVHEATDLAAQLASVLQFMASTRCDEAGDAYGARTSSTVKLAGC